MKASYRSICFINATAFSLTIAAAAIVAQPAMAKQKKNPIIGNILRGKQIYVANGCANCHTINGQGGSGGPDLSTVAARQGHNYTWFKKVISSPALIKQGSVMPAYNTLTDRDMRDLISYLSSLKKIGLN